MGDDARQATQSFQIDPTYKSQIQLKFMQYNRALSTIKKQQDNKSSMNKIYGKKNQKIEQSMSREPSIRIQFSQNLLDTSDTQMLDRLINTNVHELKTKDLKTNSVQSFISGGLQSHKKIPPIQKKDQQQEIMVSHQLISSFKNLKANDQSFHNFLDQLNQMPPIRQVSRSTYIKSEKKLNQTQKSRSSDIKRNLISESPIKTSAQVSSQKFTYIPGGGIGLAQNGSNLFKMFYMYEQELLSYISKKELSNVIEIIVLILESCVDFNQIFLFTQLTNFLGLYCRDLEEYDKSSFFFQQYKLIATLTNNIKQMSDSYINLAIIGTKIQMFENSTRLLKKALQYAWKANDLDQELEIYELIGLNYFYLGNIEEAKFYHNKFIRADNELQDSPLRTISLSIINNQLSNPEESSFTEFNRLFLLRLSLPILNKFEVELKNLSYKEIQYSDSRDQHLCDTFKAIKYYNAKAEVILQSIPEEKNFLAFELDQPVYSRLREVLAKSQLENQNQRFIIHDAQAIDFSFVEKERTRKSRLIIRPRMPKFKGLFENELAAHQHKKMPINIEENPYSFRLSVDRLIQNREKASVSPEERLQIIKQTIGNNLHKSSQKRQKIHLNHKSEQNTLKIRSCSTEPQLLKRKYQLFFKKVLEQMES